MSTVVGFSAQLTDEEAQQLADLLDRLRASVETHGAVPARA
jgi:hypothetical protein